MIVQLPSERAGERVLEDLVGGAVVDDPEMGAVGDDVLGVLVAAVEVEAAGGVLAAGEAAGGAGVSIDLVLLGIDDPDVGAVGGDAFDLGWRRSSRRPSRSRAGAAGVVDVDLLVGVHDPDLVAGRGAGGAARGGVAAVQGVVLDGRAGARRTRRCGRGLPSLTT